MARRSDQRRAAAFALYQADVTGRPLEDTMPRDASLFTRSLAYAAEDRPEELDERIAPPPPGGGGGPRADPPAGEGNHARRAHRDAPSRRRPRRHADPRRGRDRAGG